MWVIALHEPIGFVTKCHELALVQDADSRQVTIALEESDLLVAQPMSAGFRWWEEFSLERSAGQVA
jgi:hypothetical protein